MVATTPPEKEPKLFSWPEPANRTASTAQQAAEQAQTLADAKQQGYDAGYAEGLAKAQAAGAEQARQALQDITELGRQAAAFVEQWRGAQVELLQLISQELIGRELSVAPEVLVSLLGKGQALLRVWIPW